MKEELITWETAKLALQKGFIINSQDFYTKEGNLVWETDEYELYCYAPTQSLLQRWLRENHDLTMSIFLNQDKRWTNNVTTIKNHKLRGGCYGDTYEEALEKGLQIALNLIK